MTALTQIRFPHSPGRGYHDRKIADGKTPKEALFLPKGRKHRFVVLGDRPARLLQITTPAQFERFAADVGVPATRPGLPAPAPPDVERLLAAAAHHDIDILPRTDG